MPLVEHSTFHYELPPTKNLFFLNPLLFSDLSKDPFTDSARISDIDFGATTPPVVQIKIALPKGFKLVELPEHKEIYSIDSSISFIYRNKIENDTVDVSSSIEIKKAIFDTQEYAALKRVFEKIYGLLSNQILLQKKDEN